LLNPAKNDYVKLSQSFLQQELSSEFSAEGCFAGLNFTISVLAASTEIIDGVQVELSCSLNFDSPTLPTTYHRFTVNWLVNPNATGDKDAFEPQTVLPLEHGAQVAWCELPLSSTNLHLSELAKKNGDAAVELYHRKMGYLGAYSDSGPNLDALLQKRAAQCAGSDNLPSSYTLREGTAYSSCFTRETVMNQGGCGSCWAYAAAHAATGRMCMQDPVLTGQGQKFLSTQNVLSCNANKEGCEGGWMGTAFSEWQNGAALESDYAYNPSGTGFPWHALGLNCQWGLYAKPLVVTSVYGVDSNVQAMQTELYCNGPFTLAFAVYENFFSYRSGVYSQTSGNMAGGHAVTLVGYGTDSASSMPFWEIKNSWGPDWGDNGHFKMLRGQDLCNVESWGLVAAMVTKTSGSWIYKDWSDCVVKNKTRGIQCVANSNLAQVQDNTNCPTNNGWPNPSTFPAKDSTVSAETYPMASTSCDSIFVCSDAYCNGNGRSSVDASLSCMCSCKAGYVGA